MADTDSRAVAAQRKGRGSVLVALGANVAVALAKFLGFLFTGAASLLAEAIHSVADSANEALLLFGGARARRRPSAEHPFGYGRERYFWAFVVAVVLFTGGGLFALFEAEEKLRDPHAIGSIPWALGIIVAAMIFEGISLRTAIRRSRPLKKDETWLAFIRRSKQAELTVVLLEDAGALLGLSFAFAGIALVTLTGDSRFDALGSLAIGVLLVVIALLLAIEMKSFLIGESADHADIASISRLLEAGDHVDRVVSLRTEQLGPEQLLVGAKLCLDLDDVEAREIPTILEELEQALRSELPSVAVVYLEPVHGQPSGSGARRTGKDNTRANDI